MRVRNVLGLGWIGVLFVAVGPPWAMAQDAPLRFSVYATSGSVHRMASEESERQRALDVFTRLGVDGIYIEVYRGGDIVSPEELVFLRDFFAAQGMRVVGGIATVPGGDFGVEADVGLHWFNFQNAKTRRDLEGVMRASAPIFDTFIVDDFLCSGDRSAESDAARGARSWGDYRRDMMTTVASETILRPAREANPDITMIVKFPQWYDRFHLFGYDVTRMPQLFDRVWVGTETRGARTQRYGFVQPYEGFVNYRWIRALSGNKIGGAWFDHGDCGPHDFIEQAWQSVLAGAPEIVFFCYGDIAGGHPDHERLREAAPDLQRLAQAVRETPVTGIPAYKPPHSDAGGDLYVMDFTGMLGVPLVPTPVFPEGSPRVFLPTQAAADPDVAGKITAAEGPETLVMTAGFLAALNDDATVLEWAGVGKPSAGAPLDASAIIADGRETPIAPALRLAGNLEVNGATVLLEAVAGEQRVPYLTVHECGGRRVVVFNNHTFSQADFDAVGEVLLAPRDLGMLELPQAWVDTLRRELSGWAGNDFPDGAVLSAPARVTFQPVGAGWFVQNYHDEDTAVHLSFPRELALQDGFTGASAGSPGAEYEHVLPPRSRLWLTP